MQAAVHRPGRFAIPRLRRSAISRAHLSDRLHANIGTGLAVLEAPAGYGKTALAAGFARELESSFSVRWLSLDSSCNAPEVMAEQIAAALLGSEPWRPATASKLDDLKAYLANVAGEAVKASEAPLLLVVDNVQELHDAVESTDLLGWAIELLPEGAEVILSGRRAVPLVEVDRRVAAGECLHLGPPDLAFREEEMEELLRATEATGDPAAIREATAGWPIAVLAVLTGTVPLEATAGAENGDAWDRYLAKEVWQTVPAPAQASLLRLSITPTIEPERAAMLVGSGGWQAVEDWLSSHDVAAETLEGGEIRLNPLVKRFLQQHFKTSGRAAYRQACGEDIVYLEADGRIADAVELARELKRHDCLAGLIERNAGGMLLSGACGLLWRAYHGLPGSVVTSSPRLQAFGARILAHENRPQQAIEAAESVLDAASAPAEARLHALLGKARALRLLGRLGEMEKLFANIHRAVDCEAPAVFAEVEWQEAQMVLATTSDFARAERLLNHAREQAEQASAPLLALLTRSTLGQLYAMRGDGPSAVAELARAARGWRDLKGSTNLGWVLNNLGMAHLLVGDFESATSVLQDAIDEGRACENTRNEAYAIASLADAQLALGRYEDARVNYEEAIRLCATEVLDESLASLSIAGLALALLGLRDLQQADYFAQRALMVAESFGNPLELGTCKLHLGLVEDAAENHAAAISLASDAVKLFESIEARASLRTAWYRLALFYFRANRRPEAEEALREVDGLVTEPWMAGGLLPAVREHPMFAQWAALRGLRRPWFKEMVDSEAFAPSEPGTEPLPAVSRFPLVTARSLGAARVAMNGKEIPDEAWTSARSKELFFLFLAHREGLRKDEAVEALYPDLPQAKCNSAFHSNLYRVRRALYPESIVKQDGAYRLNPEGEFEWDVEAFENALAAARKLPGGSDDRATALRSAVELYQGPFSAAFYSEWAEALRRRLDQHNQEVLSTLAGYHAARNEWEPAGDYLERLLEADRYNEEAAYQLANCRLKADGPVVALAFLDGYRKTLADELNEELPSRFQKLRQEIASGTAV